MDLKFSPNSSWDAWAVCSHHFEHTKVKCSQLNWINDALFSPLCWTKMHPIHLSIHTQNVEQRTPQTRKRHTRAALTLFDGDSDGCCQRRSESKNNLSNWKTLAAPCEVHTDDDNDEIYYKRWRVCAHMHQVCAHFGYSSSVLTRSSGCWCWCATVSQRLTDLYMRDCICTQSVGQQWFLIVDVDNENNFQIWFSARIHSRRMVLRFAVENDCSL